MAILLIDNFDSFTFNLYQMLQAQTDLDITVHRNNALTLSDIHALKPAGIVLSPGPGHPANPADVGICSDILAWQADLNCPVLGVCLGHQLIAHHFGGTIERAPNVMHGKTSRIEISPSFTPLFKNLPPTFDVMRYHSLTVSPTDFPAALQITATTGDGIIMALQHRTQPIYGVQFHPESIGTPEGNRLLGNFLALCKTQVPA